MLPKEANIRSFSTRVQVVVLLLSSTFQLTEYFEITKL